MKKAFRLGAERSDRGAAAVEFALVVPFLFLLLFGIIQYGLYFWAYQGGSDIARSAARLSAVGDPPTCAAFKAKLTPELADMGDNIVIKRTFTDTDSNGAIQAGDTVKVTVQFDSTDLQLPFLPFINNGRVKATADARVEGTNQGQPENCP